MKIALALLAMAASTTAFASQPGQPLDCSDWVFSSPQYRCDVLVLPCPGDSRCSPGTNFVSTLTRERLWLRMSGTGRLCPYGGGSSQLARLELVETPLSPGAEKVVGYVEERCVRDDYIDAIQPTFDNAFTTFDQLSGSALVTLHSYSRTTCISCDRYGQNALIGVSGFTTLYDVQQTYAPSLGAFMYRVPALPEGLARASQFDTYTGEVTRPLDLSQARPLQCSYPSMPPQAGDLELITAPVPTPAPGAAVYVLTRVSYQGQTRAGRRTNTEGRLVGRDTSVLPTCDVQLTH